MLDKTANTPVINIRRGVPIPKTNSGRWRGSKYPFAAMNVGDSFVFPPGTKMSAAYAATSRATKDLGWIFKTRSMPEGVACWRVA